MGQVSGRSVLSLVSLLLKSKKAFEHKFGSNAFLL